MNYKSCPKCVTNLPVEAFAVASKRKDGRASWCKSCTNKWNRTTFQDPTHDRRLKIVQANKATRARNRAYTKAYLLDHPCVDCGESDVDVLDFDHVRGIKLREVARLAGDGASLKVIQAEIDKCEVRCANCHRRITRRRERELVALEGIEPSSPT